MLIKAPRGMRIRSPKIAIPNFLCPPSVFVNRTRERRTMAGKLAMASRLSKRDDCLC